MTPLVHVDVFSGIGGFALAAAATGFETRLFCEIEPFCQRVLAHHWPEVAIHDDARTLTPATLAAAGVTTVDLLTGGVPCQPVSIVGRRRGTNDERWLWPAFLDIVCHAQPRWVVAENPCGLLSLADVRGVRVFPALLGALAALGYRIGWCCDGVDDVGAPHQRERVFIVAHREDREMADAAGQLDTSSRSDLADDVGEASGKTDRGGQKSVLNAVTHPVHILAETDIKTVDWFGRAFCVGHADAKGARHARGRKRGGTEASQPRSQHDGQNLAAQAGRRYAESRMGVATDGLPLDLARHPRWPAAQGSFQYAWEAPRTVSTTPECGAKLTAVGNSVSPQQAVLVLDPIARYEGQEVTP